MQATQDAPSQPTGCPIAGTIDCDIHPAVPGMQALLPYLDSHWREQVVLRGIDGLDLVMWKPSMPLSARPDFRPESGKPGTSLEMLQRQALDGFGTRAAICNPLWGAQAIPSDDLAMALCRAINDWMAREWLDHEPRLRASILVPTQCPDMAAEEIERCAADRRFVQVLLPAMGELPLGRRQHWPIYRTAERLGLPVGIHAGGTYRHPPTATGWPSFHAEDYAGQAQAFQSQVLSLVYEGVFSEFPSLKVVLLESGVTWLPNFMWRAVKTWRGLRAEVPWVKRSPAELMREHLRLTIQPLHGPPDPAGLERVLDQIGSDRMLLFATDYPHWQFEGNAAVPAGLPARMLDRVLWGNALETYPRLQEAMQ